jgi:hypothetical protein
MVGAALLVSVVGTWQPQIISSYKSGIFEINNKIGFLLFKRIPSYELARDYRWDIFS